MSRNTAETQISLEVHHEHRAGWPPALQEETDVIIDSQLMTYISRQANKKEETKEERSVFVGGFFWGVYSFYVC